MLLETVRLLLIPNRPMIWDLGGVHMIVCRRCAYLLGRGEFPNWGPKCRCVYVNGKEYLRVCEAWSEPH